MNLRLKEGDWKNSWPVLIYFNILFNVSKWTESHENLLCKK